MEEPMAKCISEMKMLLHGRQHIVFFGGAGTSTESGLKDFRGEEGLGKETLSPEVALSHDFFWKHTGRFYDYYRKNLLQKVLPNAAHRALARLEGMGILDGVVTQNIDGLHQAAGSRKVVELHGSVLRNFCTRCGRPYAVEEIRSGEGVPFCGCGGVIKPDVVLYGEMLKTKDMEAADALIQGADLLIVGGTSLSVYPAAGFAKNYRGPVILMNKTVTPMDARAALVIRHPIAAVFEALMAEIE